MAIAIPRGTSDAVMDEIIKVLVKYESDHPHARIDIYRQNSVSVRIRIIDPDLSGKKRTQRSEAAWSYLSELPDDVQSDISTVLLLTPEETGSSFANFEFDDPIPSKL